MIMIIYWWLENIRNSGNHIFLKLPDFEMFVDASEDGWGAHAGDSETGRRWNSQEIQDHINVLELRAIYFALKSFCKQDSVHSKVSLTIPQR